MPCAHRAVVPFERTPLPRLPLQEVADLDSISFMALVTTIHDHTGIQIPFQDYPKLATLNSFVTYLMGASRPVDSA